MENFGFVKVAAASPRVQVADPQYNVERIYESIVKAQAQDVSIVVFPELSITAYTCGDLFNQQLLIDKAAESLVWLCEQTKKLDIVSIVGLPIVVDNCLYNAAAVLGRGQIYGIVPKTFIPNYGEFYEKRWFASARELNQNYLRLKGYPHEILISNDIIFQMNDCQFGIEICEDLWTTIPPSSFGALYGADIIFNLSASNETVGKHSYRRNLVAMQSAKCLSGYVYSSVPSTESTTDLVYSGCTLIAENGQVLAEGERYSFEDQLIVADIDVERLRQERLRNKSFTTAEYRTLDRVEYSYIAVDKIGEQSLKSEKEYNLDRYIAKSPFVPIDREELHNACQDIFSIQSNGLARRLMHTGIQKSVIGVSGGLDSTLALLVLVETYDKLGIDRKYIYGITMPGFGTSDRTYDNAVKLMEELGITTLEISIADSVIQHFKDIEHDIDNHDVTYENAQARERTQILMDYSNKIGGLVVGTGDLSELALGWCTYNGDHMSMYAVNGSVPKTLVRALVAWYADHKMSGAVQDVLHDIVATPVSPELLPSATKGEIAQITEDVVGPYILHDFFLYYMLRFGFSPKKIFFLAQNAFKGDYADAQIIGWMKVCYRRFFTQQFKRSCLPDGPKVGSVSLSPRGDWKMPSDASYNLWMSELERL